MSEFDIESLLKFQPAGIWCANCLALWEDISFLEKNPFECRKDYNAFVVDERERFIQCKICGAIYTSNEHKTIYDIKKFIEYETDLPLKNIDNIVEHGKRLASISPEMRIHKFGYPPMRLLFMALSEARSFVHFISWGITQLMIGALKVTAQRVPVRGIVSGSIGEQIMCEINDFKHEAPNLYIEFCEHEGLRNIDIPHQKLVVIDGLLAFKGSANLSQTSWRSAAKNMEIIEVVSNINEIINIHNKFFSPIWGKMKRKDLVNKHGKIQIL